MDYGNSGTAGKAGLTLSEKATEGIMASMEDGNLPEGAEIVETRFGRISIQREKSLYIPNGLLGIPGNSFCLAAFPEGKLEQFRILQCLDDMELSFAVLPLGWENPLIEAKDMEAGCRDLGIEKDNLLMLLIVTVHREPERVQISANVRAPLLIDVQTRQGTQYVFTNPKYQIRQVIN